MLVYTEGKHHVLECKFESLKNHAISFNSANDDNKLFTEFCYFSDVASPKENGGAIFFRNHGEVIINKVCASNCNCADKNGHFSYAEVTNSLNYKNHLNFSSISSCGIEGKGLYACWFQYGEAEMTETNISQCKGEYAGFNFRELKSSSVVKFSILDKVNSSDWYVFAFSKNEEGVKCCKCIYKENSGKIYLITSETQPQLYIEECILIRNSANYIFYCRNANMTVSHCYLENNKGYTTSGYNSYSFNTSQMNTQKFDLEINLLNQDSCDAILLYLSYRDHHKFGLKFCSILSIFTLKL